MAQYEYYKAVQKYVRPGQSVLEAGCGWAFTSFALAEYGARATAIDISPKLVTDLQRLQQQLGGAYTSHLSITVGDIFRLPALGQTFDAVTSDGTYEHFLKDSDRKDILGSVRAVLREEGLFIVAVPNLRNPFFRFVVERKMPDMHPFTIESLVKELKQGGFCVLETGFSFVNPGFQQWIKSRWMTAPIHMVNAVFPLLPRMGKSLLGAHVFCVAKKTG